MEHLLMYHSWNTRNTTPNSSHNRLGLALKNQWGSSHSNYSGRIPRAPGVKNVNHYNHGPVISQPGEMPPPRMMGPPQYSIHRGGNSFHPHQFLNRGNAHMNRPLRPMLQQQQFHQQGQMTPQQHFQSYHSWQPWQRKKEIISSRGRIATRNRLPPIKERGKNVKKRGMQNRNISRKVKPQMTKVSSTSSMDPSDPLNIHGLIAESEKRAMLGEPPLPGDSTFNTPSVSEAGDNFPIVNITPTSPQTTSVDKPVERRLNKKSVYNRKTMYQKFGIGRGKFRNNRGLRYNFGRRHGRGKPLTGNYSNYYFRRDPQARLDLMCDWFSGKTVLDYGCNNGTFSIMLLERYPDIKKLDAVDCDGELIQNARHILREKCRRESFKAQEESSTLDYNKINFQTADWLDDNSLEESDNPTYDVIYAFSVTKWIHLNHGDAGLQKFFRRVFNHLKPGGHFIIEPQPQKSYRKSIQTAAHKEFYNTMRIIPTKLEPVLADLGFCYFEHIKDPNLKQFKRMIILCTKASGQTPIPIRDVAIKRAQEYGSSPEVQLDESEAVPRNIPPAVDYNLPSSSYVQPDAYSSLPSDTLKSPVLVTSTTCDSQILPVVINPITLISDTVSSLTSDSLPTTSTISEESPFEHGDNLPDSSNIDPINSGDILDSEVNLE